MIDAMAKMFKSRWDIELPKPIPKPKVEDHSKTKYCPTCEK